MDRKGNPVTISQHRGKVVVVTFWASWCPPCRRELPMLAQIQSIVGREGCVAHVHRGYSEAVFERFIEEILALLPPEVLARPATAPAT